jgi:thioredoxin 1
MAGLGVLEVSDATFDQEVLKSEQPVLVDFWAEWCGPCKAIAPTVDALAAKYAGQLKVTKVNVDQNGATPSRYGIRGIPALLLFKGGKVADQIVGYVPQDVIEEKVQRLLASAPAGIA